MPRGICFQQSVWIRSYGGDIWGFLKGSPIAEGSLGPFRSSASRGWGPPASTAAPPLSVLCLVRASDKQDDKRQSNRSDPIAHVAEDQLRSTAQQKGHGEHGCEKPPRGAYQRRSLACEPAPGFSSSQDWQAPARLFRECTAHAWPDTRDRQRERDGPPRLDHNPAFGIGLASPCRSRRHRLQAFLASQFPRERRDRPVGGSRLSRATPDRVRSLPRKPPPQAEALGEVAERDPSWSGDRLGRAQAERTVWADQRSR